MCSRMVPRRSVSLQTPSELEANSSLLQTGACKTVSSVSLLGRLHHKRLTAPTARFYPPSPPPVNPPFS
ncbi:hypothetical protein BDM02DRAFT_3037162 [Thelephora ganbajun]|uniref:Uncharacterized protein n=1 Tax=Thelephora ganbajun TaxID=370292 RepID=A0ACB6ZAJ4_THEGA|nr:hypothetical protein BDM02DRAFT_3037162 [Thelephora ganbajun]